jgi:hypothetical protein
MREERRRGVRASLEAWARSDPERARSAAEELAADHPRLREQIWSSLARGWVHADRGPEGLAAHLAGLRPARHRDEAADAALRELVRAGGAAPALAWADPILRDETQDAVFQRAVFESAVRGAATVDPERTAAWVRERLEAAYAADGSLLLAERWIRADGASAMRWLGETPAGERRDRAVRKAFVEWLRADRPGAKAWLDAVSATEFHGPALEAWAEQIVAREPLEALGSCQRIVDPAQRERCLESTATNWYARDAVGAEAWLQQSPLDEESRGKVRRPARLGPSRPRRPFGAGGPR